MSAKEIEYDRLPKTHLSPRECERVKKVGTRSNHGEGVSHRCTPCFSLGTFVPALLFILHSFAHITLRGSFSLLSCFMKLFIIISSYRMVHFTFPS